MNKYTLGGRAFLWKVGSNLSNKLLCGKVKRMFSVLKKVRIDDVKTDVFNLIIDDLIKQGWCANNTYNEFNSWIDYGQVVLTKNSVKLVFEWDNWTEGVIKGPKDLVSKIGRAYELNKPEFVLL